MSALKPEISIVHEVISKQTLVCIRWPDNGVSGVRKDFVQLLQPDGKVIFVQNSDEHAIYCRKLLKELNINILD